MLRVNKAPFRLSAYTNLDSDGNPMLKDHAYKAQGPGFVCATCQSEGPGTYVKGFVGLTSNPAAEGDMLGYNAFAGTTLGESICIPVAKDEYFECYTDSANPILIWWKSVGTLKKPIDFN